MHILLVTAFTSFLHCKMSLWEKITSRVCFTLETVVLIAVPGRRRAMLVMSVTSNETLLTVLELAVKCRLISSPASRFPRILVTLQRTTLPTPMIPVVIKNNVHMKDLIWKGNERKAFTLLCHTGHLDEWGSWGQHPSPHTHKRLQVGYELNGKCLVQLQHGEKCSR